MTPQAMNANDTAIWERTQRKLAAGVLRQAAHDLRRFHDAVSPIERELYFDAYSWVMSDDPGWPFSFLNSCRILNRLPEDLRQELLGDISLGALGQWVRRLQRAARRLSGSLTQSFAREDHVSVSIPASLLETSY